MEPLLSIIIPTKNRYEYLTHLTNFFNSIDDNKIELVIQDNSDNQSQDFLKLIEDINDVRIKYFYQQKHLSVIDNCDKAIINSKGEYIVMLGDDDGFLPELTSWVEKMKSSKVDVLLPEKANYSWPDIVHKHHKFSGLLTFNKVDNTLLKIDVERELKKVLNYGGAFMFNLPRLYHAVVSRKILDKIYLKTDSYFPGPSPDMANAIALSLLNPETYYIKRPIIISGKGFKSTGGQGLRRGHIGKIEEIKHLPSNTSKDWDIKIPKIWTGQTIYAESILKSLERNGRSDLIKEFNFLRFYSNLTGKHFNLYNLVKPYIKWYQYPVFLFYLLTFIMLRVKLFVKNKLKTNSNKTKDLITINEIPDIQNAIDKLKLKMN